MPDPSFVLPLLFQSAILPFAITLAVLLALHKSRAALATSLAVALGFIAGYFAVFHTQWSFAPQQALDWLPWIVALAVAGAMAAESIQNKGARTILQLAVSLCATALVTWPAISGIGMQKTLATIVVAGVMMTIVWNSLASAGGRTPAPPLILAVVAGGAGLTLMLDASLLIGQLMGALAVAIATCAAFSIRHSHAVFSGAAAGVAALVLGALFVNAYVYAGFPLGYVLLLASGLLANPAVEAIRRFRRRPADARTWMIATALAAIPVMTTIGLAFRAAHEAGGY